MEREPRFAEGEGGFVAADPRPLISGFLVRCGKGVFAAAKCFIVEKSLFAAVNQ